MEDKKEKEKMYLGMTYPKGLTDEKLLEVWKACRRKDVENGKKQRKEKTTIGERLLETI